MNGIDAIIVSAGTGKRFGGEVPKQYVEVLGKKIIEWTISAFRRAAMIDGIIVVANPDHFDQFEGIEGIDDLVAGGKERVDSVINGIRAAKRDFVAIHDGARPLVRPENIDAVARNAIEYGASILAIKANETVKEARDSFITRTPNRSTLYLARTPQVFKRSVLLSSLENLPSGILPTDDAQAMELMGERVHITIDDPANIKITHQYDLHIVRAVLAENRR